MLVLTVKRSSFTHCDPSAVPSMWEGRHTLFPAYLVVCLESLVCMGRMHSTHVMLPKQRCIG